MMTKTIATETENIQKEETDPKKRDIFYQLVAENDPSWRITKQTAQAGGVKAEFLYDGWVYENRKDAEAAAKKHSVNKRKISVVPYYSTELRDIWYGTKPQKALARKKISLEIKRNQSSSKRQELISKFHNDSRSLHFTWLVAEKLPEEYSEKEKKAHAYYKPLWDELLNEEEQAKLRKHDIKIEEEALQEAEESQEENHQDHGPYYVNRKGVYLKGKDGEDSTLISSPIWAEAHLRAFDGKDHTLLVKVFDGERDHLVAIPKKAIHKFAEIGEILSDLNQKIPIDPPFQKHLQKYLQNLDPIEKMRCVDKSGWYEDQYVFPNGLVIGSAEEKVYPVGQQSAEGFRTKGTLEEWQREVVEKCIGNSRMVFALGISLGGPCLELVRIEGGGFNFVGESSKGKTKIAMVAASVFGNPTIKAGIIRSWNTTTTALESTCCTHNDGLLVLDELGQDEAKKAGQMAYMITAGVSKGRGKQDASKRPDKTWRTIVLSTAEVNLESHVQEGKSKARAGQMVRLTDIPAVVGLYGCFEYIHGYPNSQEFADAVGEACADHYGVAAPFFLKKMMEYGLQQCREDLCHSIDDFVADYAGNSSDQVKRVAKRFGVVYGALLLAKRLGVLGDRLGKNLDEHPDITMVEIGDYVGRVFKDWVESRGGDGDHEPAAIIAHVEGLLKEKADSSFKRFERIDSELREREPLLREIWGYRQEDQEGTTYYVLPKPYTTHLCEGFNHNQVTNVLFQAGMLSKDSKGKYSENKYIPAVGKADRYRVIRLEAPKEDDSE